MVLGGIIIPSENVDQFNKTMKQFRIEQKMFSELKWSKVTNQKLSEYKRFVEYFFALNNTDKLHFHSIIIDNHQINYKKFSKGDKEAGFYKFYYQLLLHCFGKRYCREGKNDRFIVNLDQRTSSYSLNTLRIILNRGMKKKFSIDSSPFVSIEPRDSKQSELIQINDIIVGAIGFQKNGYDLLADTRQAKKELAMYIANEAGLSNLKEDSPWGQNRLTIWNFRLRK
jgi:hypothetical protein